MAKQQWKPGNMLYPLPAVMVSVTDGKGEVGPCKGELERRKGEVYGYSWYSGYSVSSISHTHVYK